MDTFFYWVGVVESSFTVVFGVMMLISIYNNNKFNKYCEKSHQQFQEQIEAWDVRLAGERTQANWNRRTDPAGAWNAIPAEVQVNMLEESFNKDEQ